MWNFSKYVAEQILEGTAVTYGTPVSLADEEWFLLLADDSVLLIRTIERDVETRFLGRPRGGSYAERIRLDDNHDPSLTIHFEHPSLPAPLELSAPVGTADMEGLTALQAKLQEWTLSGHERPD